MKIKNIGIIGYGYVGKAMFSLFDKLYDIKIFDINLYKSTHSKEEVLNCDVVFISVPTPMNPDGSQNLSNVYSALEGYNTNSLYVLKSTVIPGTTKSFVHSHADIKIVVNPEFLTEANWLNDIKNPSRVLIGDDNGYGYVLYDLYRQIYTMSTKFFVMKSEEAELIKYMSNSFLATKLSFVNEFKILSDLLDLDWDNVIQGFISDPRIGSSHTQVPGIDGHIGYGGSCFPKDINAIITFSDTKGVSLNTVKAGWKTNVEIRPQIQNN